MPQHEFEGVAWRKSNRSNNECVEVAISDQAVGVRDSKNPTGAILTFSPAEWQAFLDGVEAGEFNFGDSGRR